LSIFSIRHLTTYRYRNPVLPGVHRLQLRPRESRNIRIISMDLEVTPAGVLTWANDVFGNSVASVAFSAATDTLSIESKIVLEHTAIAWPVFDIAPAAASYPFRYTDDDGYDLGALLTPQYADPDGRLYAWVRGFVRGTTTDTLALLKDINAAISAWIVYEAREDEGTQPPLLTLDRRLGSCRDIAVLMIEAVRRLGFGARIVSGYLINRLEFSGAMVGSADSGSTHAWVEIFLPGAGWVTFDPTNRTVGDFSLIPVAVARDIKQAVPVSGSFSGKPDDFLSMSVEVFVGS
jgi:transglutaminase-like putative cysteine protease